ncbi:MAG: hypothetical protein M3421_11105 [Bacteroidota bacterium]|nr:hypothetical protein [Bacteroidota bacterium]
MPIQQSQIKMFHKTTVLLFLLCLVSITILKAEKPSKRYIWSKSGILVYASSSHQGKAIDTLAYGFVIENFEQLSKLEKTDLIFIPRHEEDNPEINQSYAHQSEWYRIGYPGGKGYIKNTYLMPIPPPLVYDSYVSISEYLGQFANVVSEEHHLHTEEFCSHDKYAFSTGAYHFFTDLGPCESCGQIITETYLPGLDVHQGYLFVMILHHITLDISSPSDDPYQSGMINFYPQTDGSLKFSTDYTQYTIATQQGGILIHEDTSM